MDTCDEVRQRGKQIWSLSLTFVDEEDMSARPTFSTVISIEDPLHIMAWRFLKETTPSPRMESGSLNVYRGHPSRCRHKDDTMGAHGPPNNFPNQNRLPGASHATLLARSRIDAVHTRTHLLVR